MNLNKEHFYSIFNENEGVRLKQSKTKSKTKLNEKWECQFAMEYRKHKYCQGGNTPESAEDAVCEEILRHIDGISLPTTKYSCTKPNSRADFQKFRDKNKWRAAEKMSPGEKLHYTWESASSSWYSLCIKQPPWKKSAMAEVTFAIYRTCVYLNVFSISTTERIGSIKRMELKTIISKLVYAKCF